MDSPFIVFDSDYEGRRPKLGQKRCKIGLSILMKEGAKFRTKITFQKVPNWKEWESNFLP